MPPTLEFTVSDLSLKDEKEVDKSHQQAAENIVKLLNHLPPDELDFLDQRLHSVTQESKSTAAEDALVAELTGYQFSELERGKLEFVSLVRNFQWRRELLKGALSASQVADLLGTSRQTPHDRVKSNSLLAVSDRGAWRFPAWQFDPEGPDGVIDGLPEVLKALKVSQLSKLSWLVRPNSFLDGLTPVEALKQGQKERVIAEAVGIGAG